MPWFCPKPSFHHPGSWFYHRLGSEDHAMPWFCPKPSFHHPGSWFYHRLEITKKYVWDFDFRGVSSSTKPLNQAPSQETQPLAELCTRTL